MEFINAKKMNQMSPATFEIPSKEDLDSIKEGDDVKICAEPERFWVKVKLVAGDILSGTVNNDLIKTRSHGLKCGDPVIFTKENVYQIMKEDEKC